MKVNGTRAGCPVSSGALDIYEPGNCQRSTREQDMSLRDRLDTIRNEPVSVAVAAKGAMGIDKKQYANLKTHIHQTLLDRINLEAMEDLPPQRLKEELKNLVERLLEDENVVINDIERRNLVRDIQYEMLGLGPLEPLLADATISDILVNSS